VGRCGIGDQGNTDLIADLPLIEALMDRALVLDESYDHGAIHSLLLSYEMSRPGCTTEERIKNAQTHFERAWNSRKVEMPDRL